MDTPYCVVFITAGSWEEAQRLAQALVQRRLAACVTLVPQVESFYWWQGEVARGQEVLLLVKTTREKWSALADAVAELHSYQVPEIIALPIEAGSEAYLKWLEHSLKEP